MKYENYVTKIKDVKNLNLNWKQKDKVLNLIIDKFLEEEFIGNEYSLPVINEVLKQAEEEKVNLQNQAFSSYINNQQ